MTISRAAVAGIVSASLIGSGVGEPPNTAQGHGARHHSPSVVGALSGGDVSDAPEGIPVEVVEQVAADMGVSPELAEAHLIWQADFERSESSLRKSYPETYGGGFISGPMTGTIHFVKGAQWDRISIGLEGVTVMADRLVSERVLDAEVDRMAEILAGGAGLQDGWSVHPDYSRGEIKITLDSGSVASLGSAGAVGSTVGAPIDAVLNPPVGAKVNVGWANISGRV